VLVVPSCELPLVSLVKLKNPLPSVVVVAPLVAGKEATPLWPANQRVIVAPMTG
jgi:hypothetical protein